MRGDRPQVEEWQDWQTVFTPHARGSTVPHRLDPAGAVVYPACAGIDLLCLLFSAHCNSLPRMRGDRPWEVDVLTKESEFTPHARGSTASQKQEKASAEVYPACAGIDLGIGKNLRRENGLPRMRGDRPVHGCRGL